MLHFCYIDTMTTPLPVAIGKPAINALEAVNINSLEAVSKLTEKELASLHGVGPKAIRILKQHLDENKMHLLTTDHKKSSKT